MVEEKENRIKEGLKMMGLSNIVFWLSWGITYMIMMLITSIILTLMLSRGLFDVLSPALVFFVFFFFSLATIALAIVCSLILLFWISFHAALHLNTWTI
jgi:hypothetical protein